jgi:hypothetical protein
MRRRAFCIFENPHLGWGFRIGFSDKADKKLLLIKWCRGYYVDTAGKNAQKISEYIGNQLKEEKLGDLLPFDENPFSKPDGRVRQAVKTLFKRG